ncbi:MAG: DUF1566 domain-containing protein [Methylococcus sp.]
MSPSRHSLNTSTFTLALAALLVPPGASAAGKLVFAPVSLDFGFNALGEAKTKVVTLKNGTAVDIPLYPATLADDPGRYAILSTTCGVTLPAGQTCKYTLKYTAKSLPPAAARLELTTLNPAFPMLKLPLQANRYSALNDTGITRCGNDFENSLTCPVPNFPDQDAQFGRDKIRNVASNGKAGFNYTKLDSQGKALPASAKNWDCVRDNVTGLVWERKPKGDGAIGNQGLHDADDIYTWYSTDSGNNGGSPGEPNPNGNYCFGYQPGRAGTYCNIQAYVHRVNTAGWCGFKDWRVPDRFELLGLVDLSILWSDPTIDVSYFPDTILTVYWAISSYAYDAYYAWNVDFQSGDSRYSGRYNNGAVRLVRGDQ